MNIIVDWNKNEWWGPVCSKCKEKAQTYDFGDWTIDGFKSLKTLCKNHYYIELRKQKLLKLKKS